MNVVRLNQRNCGGTEHLSAGLFHSGLTHDARHVIDELTRVDGTARDRRRRLFARRQSGAEARRRVRRHAAAALAAVAAVSPDPRDRRVRARTGAPSQLPLPVELRTRSEAPDAAEGAGACPACSTCRSSSAIRTVRDFDDVYTAPHFGFDGAEDYYYRASAMRVIDRIRGAGADHHRRGRPVRPARPFRDPKVTGNPHITVRLCRTAATARSSAPRLATTTATGRSRRSWRSSRHRPPGLRRTAWSSPEIAQLSAALAGSA